VKLVVEIIKYHQNYHQKKMFTWQQQLQQTLAINLNHSNNIQGKVGEDNWIEL
jgi:hypothetical protein